ncbi:MAG: hypothetical protein H0U44_08930 [Flavisolibacter sp.]|jgi:hypothetical protein|nr:hypothetical protein [Flavisolibacter sp.]
MKALRIEILNQKELKLIKGMLELNLIKVTEERLNNIVEKIRPERYASPSI